MKKYRITTFASNGYEIKAENENEAVALLEESKPVYNDTDDIEIEEIVDGIEEEEEEE